MRLNIHLDQPGAELELCAAAGQVLLQVVQAGRPPVTLILTSEAAGQMVDLLGLVAVVAEEQEFELDVSAALCELHAKQQSPRALAADLWPHSPSESAWPPGAWPVDHEIPAFLRGEGA